MREMPRSGCKHVHSNAFRHLYTLLPDEIKEIGKSSSGPCSVVVANASL